MHRRKFLQDLAAATASIKALTGETSAAEPLTNLAGLETPSPTTPPLAAEPAAAPDVAGHTFVCAFQADAGVTWKVYEDLRSRDGVITFLSSRGASRVLTKSVEPTFTEARTPYLGLSLQEIGMSGRDLLADRLLRDGEPDPEQVRAAAPPLGSPPPLDRRSFGRLPWNTFVGTKECFDTQPVFPAGETKTYHPAQYIPEITAELAGRRYEGLIGGWMPAVRKVLPSGEGAYYEVVVFGDPRAHDKFIVQTWHRTAHIANGKIVQVFYGHSYPAFPPRREDPPAEAFYRALLAFADSWTEPLRDALSARLPDPSWVDLSRHAFARELMVRPGGVYPKYGAVDRDYAGSEYDGFQDIFTMSTYANLEWGRFAMARTVIDNYLTDYTDARGMINMRGPETGQFGLALALLARYYQYTRDSGLLLKHRAKIEATAGLLTDLHDESLALPREAAGYGLIHGWSESDSCLARQPMTWWLPYYSNSACAARGLKELAAVWPVIAGKAHASAMAAAARGWRQRAQALREAVVASVRKNLRRDLSPPYLGPYAGAQGTVWESLATERPSPQGWAHRAYCELLQPAVLPADLAHAVIDCMRAYGGTTLGVVANMERPHPGGRDILGFISYGYAQALLRLDRIDEYLLFLYSHRYHDHTPGSWTAGEVAGLTGGMPLFCIPAQQTTPLLVRWMLALDDADEDRLYLAKGLPRRWMGSGQEVRLAGAPTRWGQVSFTMAAEPQRQRVVATVALAGQGAPRELEVTFRLPVGRRLEAVTANGRPIRLGGPHGDAALIETKGERQFDVVAHFA